MAHKPTQEELEDLFREEDEFDMPLPNMLKYIVRLKRA